MTALLFVMNHVIRSCLPNRVRVIKLPTSLSEVPRRGKRGTIENSRGLVVLTVRHSCSYGGNMKLCSEMLLEVTVYCGKVRDQRGCLTATEHSL